MRSSVGLWLSVVCSVSTIACGRAPLHVGEPGSAGATGAAGTATGSAGAASETGAAGATGAGGATMVSGAGKFSDVCLVQADCSTGLSCICGICSTPCEPDSCTRLPVVATCPASLPSTSACVEPTAICVVECSTDGDCRSLGPTGVCTAGWCRRPLLVTTDDGGVVTCADRAAEIKARLDPIVASADRSCKTDTDCVQAPLGGSCYGDGCSLAIVSAAGAAAIAAELAVLEGEYCDAAFRAGCVGPGIENCPAEANPACVANQCQASSLFGPP